MGAHRGGRGNDGGTNRRKEKEKEDKEKEETQRREGMIRKPKGERGGHENPEEREGDTKTQM